MGLRKTTLLIVLATYLTLIALLYVFSAVILQNSFSFLEEKGLVTSVTRARNEVAHVIASVDSIVTDWSNWDDSYAFAKGENPTFIAENIADQTFVDQNLEVIAFYDVQGNLLWGARFDQVLKKSEKLDFDFWGMVIGPLNIVEEERSVNGLVMLPQYPLLCSMKVLRSTEGKGPAQGVLFMGRKLDAHTVFQITKRTDWKVELFNPGEDAARPGLERISGTNIFMAPKTETHMYGAVILDDVFGKPALELRVKLPRDIYAQAKEALGYAMIAMCVAGGILSLVMIVLMELRVLSPVGKLTDEVRAMAQKREFTKRIPQARSDELGVLGSNINTMLDELEKTKQDLALQCQGLQESEQFQHELFDSLQAGVVLIDPVTHYVEEVNPFALKITGHKREELVGKVCHGFLCPAEVGKCPVTDLQQKIDLSFRQIVTSDGCLVPILKSVTTVEQKGRKLLLETFVEISELVEAQEAVKISEKTYRTLFKNTGTAMVLIDIQARITLANAEFAKLVGCEPEQDFSGKILSEYVHMEDRGRLLQLVHGDQDASALSERLECRLVSKNEDIRIVLISVAEIFGTNTSVVSILDITEQKQADEALRAAHNELEDKVRERTRELEEANASLLQLDQLKSTFLSSASHELRTPLTAVLGFSRIMDKTFQKTFAPLAAGNAKLEQKAIEFSDNFGIIRLEGERLTRLINDLLDLNKIESGRIVWRDEPLDMVRLIEQAVATMNEAITGKGLELQLDLPSALPTVFVDEDRIKQVLLNLLNNAAKFTHTGYVRVWAGIATNHSLNGLRESTKDGAVVEVRVEDSGEGVREDELEKIFDNFYQSQEGDVLSDKPLGTGLGLAICRQIVKQYGGRIWVESEYGVGSTFILQMPIMQQ